MKAQADEKMVWRLGLSDALDFGSCPVNLWKGNAATSVDYSVRSNRNCIAKRHSCIRNNSLSFCGLKIQYDVVFFKQMGLI